MKYLALLLLAVPAAAVAAADLPPPVTAPLATSELPAGAFTSGPVREDALRLAQVLIPEDQYLPFLEQAAITGFDQGVDDNVDQLESEHPGFLDAMRAELRKVIREHGKADMPALHSRYARAIGAHFNSVEVAELAGFYGSRTGQKLIVGKFAGMDMSSMLAKIGEDPDATVTSDDIQTLNRSAVTKLLPHLDAEDQAALIRFGQMPSFRKLSAFTSVMAALEAHIATEPDPELDRDLDAAVGSVMARFGLNKETS